MFSASENVEANRLQCLLRNDALCRIKLKVVLITISQRILTQNSM